MTDSGPRGDIFELERIRKLVELMREFDLRELDLKQDEQQIRLCRGVEVAHGSAPVAVAHPVAHVAHAAPATQSPAAAAPASDANIVLIRSPMVGTFYSRPNPKAAPFVKVGDYVQPEKTICIIEAMKVFNEIPAEIKGRVVAVLAEDEEPVEFGKPLFKLDTSA